jgi:hypothetical protein
MLLISYYVIWYTTGAYTTIWTLKSEASEVLAGAGFLLRTHDFLQPLERPSQSPPPPATAPPQSHTDSKQQLHSQHALPGGVGTFSISHASGVPIPAAVKQEPPFALQWGAAAADPRGTLARTRSDVVAT